MSTPRRRILRFPTTPPLDESARRRLERLRKRLAADRAALARWLPRLRRAFHAMERLQSKIARAEKLIAKLEGP